MNKSQFNMPKPKEVEIAELCLATRNTPVGETARQLAFERDQLLAENELFVYDWRIQNKCIADQHDKLSQLRAQKNSLLKMLKKIQAAGTWYYSALEIDTYEKDPETGECWDGEKLEAEILALIEEMDE